MRPKTAANLVLVSLLALGCKSGGARAKEDLETPFRREAEAFLQNYTSTYQERYSESSEAEWAANTRIVEGDSSNADRVRAANERLAAFTGSVENIEAARVFLERSAELTPVQKLQLDQVLYAAASDPQTVPELVREKIAADAAQTLGNQDHGFAAGMLRGDGFRSRVRIVARRFRTHSIT